MKKIVDYQVGKVYYAEDCAGVFKIKRMTIPEIENWVSAILRDPYWIVNFGQPKVKVSTGRKHQKSAICYEYDSGVYELCLPSIYRTPVLVLHEMAHVAEFEDQHGPKFCRAYIDLVSRYYSVHWAGQLALYFEANKVDVAYFVKK